MFDSLSFCRRCGACVHSILEFEEGIVATSLIPGISYVPEETRSSLDPTADNRQ
jgi:hypothetical protein